MNRYKLTIEYDGKNFNGWQKQKNMKTVQGIIEESLFKFSGKKICVQCHAPLNGRKKFTGILTDFKDQSIHLEVDGQLQTISINRVAKANLVIEI